MREVRWVIWTGLSKQVRTRDGIWTPVYEKQKLALSTLSVLSCLFFSRSANSCKLLRIPRSVNRSFWLVSLFYRNSSPSHRARGPWLGALRSGSGQVVCSIAALLRCNSHTRKLSLLKCTIQWFLVYLQGCANITTIHFITFSSPKKKSLVH